MKRHKNAVPAEKRMSCTTTSLKVKGLKPQ